MRSLSDKDRLASFCAALGKQVRSPGRIYLVGGATAVFHGWRETTIDIDLKALPEPPGLFEAIQALKESVDINIELASPDLFSAIKTALIRYPAIQPEVFEKFLTRFLESTLQQT